MPYDVQWTSFLCSSLLGHLTRASSPLAAASAEQFLQAVGQLQPSIFKAVLFIFVSLLKVAPLLGA